MTCKRIYISLWTNYNGASPTQIAETIKFTFHYELIITAFFSIAALSFAEFTFHYELIITNMAIIAPKDLPKFTFHYELIITSLVPSKTLIQYNLHFTMN